MPIEVFFQAKEQTSGRGQVASASTGMDRGPQPWPMFKSSSPRVPFGIQLNAQKPGGREISARSLPNGVGYPFASMVSRRIRT
jgi:hypothetical protein